MADMLVLKIKHKSTLRRVSLPKGVPLTFSDLQKKIYDLFSLSAEDSMTLTYEDNEGDAVTIAADSDVEDAVVHQKLNPLRLEVHTQAKSPAPDRVMSTNFAGYPSTEAPPSLPRPLPLLSLLGMLESVKEAEVVQEAKATAVVVPPAPAAPTAPAAPAEGKSIDVVPDLAGDRVAHHGVQCDGCGVIPLLGPRFKSNTKDDYDLCKGCFDKDVAQGGADQSQYNRIDRPLFRPRVGHPLWQNSRPTSQGMTIIPSLGPLHGTLGANPHPFFNHSPPQFGPPGGFGGRPFSMNRNFGKHPTWNRVQEHRLSEGKLDGRFVKDVSVPDGTEFAPNTKFVKIWRLRNSGTLAWPHQTQLVHVGGDQLGATDVVTLQLGQEGLAAGDEIEVAVELSAPDRPGRYVGHWRLLAPGGPKFGHRVWALIHVVANGDPSPQLAHSVQEASKKAESPSQAPPTPNPAFPITPAHQQAHATASLIEQLEAARENAELRCELADLLSVVQSLPPPPTQLAGARAVAGVEKKGEYMTEEGSLGGFSMVMPFSTSTRFSDEVAEGSMASFVFAEKVTPVLQNNGEEEVEVVEVEEEGGSVEEVLVRQLVSMGFMDPVLNLAVLKQNGLDLQKALDELVSAAEWDPMMEELEEMGFMDKTMVRRLLFKNKGELKLVVKDLVHIYKAAGAGK